MQMANANNGNVPNKYALLMGLLRGLQNADEVAMATKHFYSQRTDTQTLVVEKFYPRSEEAQTASAVPPPLQNFF